MAKYAAAQLLDELMGRHRNAAPNEEKKELRWEDPEFCKFYMVKFCPHDLFINTRADLGACPKVHDDEAKAQFEKSKSYVKSEYVDEFIKFLKHLLFDVEKKIVKGRQRLALIGQKATEPLSRLSQSQHNTNEDQINLLTEKINDLVKEAEKVGMEGNVEQAQGLMKLCDQLKEERDGLRKQNENSHWSQTAELAAQQEKQMEVCEICGAFLIVGDAQSRIDDHLMGKQHVGYSRLKTALEEMTEMRLKDRENRSQVGGGFRRRDGENGFKSASEKEENERDREKERSTSRVKESRDRSRDKEDRERKERSRDYEERHRRSHHRDRDSSDRRNRSRSRDRHRSRDDRDDRRHRARDDRDDRGHRRSERDRDHHQHRSRHYNDSRRH